MNFTNLLNASLRRVFAASQGAKFTFGDELHDRSTRLTVSLSYQIIWVSNRTNREPTTDMNDEREFHQRFRLFSDGCVQYVSMSQNDYL